ncbi:hypothetical protein HMI54_012045, partial [Coelomomyces lativittatus]
MFLFSRHGSLSIFFFLQMFLTFKLCYSTPVLSNFVKSLIQTRQNLPDSSKNSFINLDLGIKENKEKQIHLFDLLNLDYKNYFESRAGTLSKPINQIKIDLQALQEGKEGIKILPPEYSTDRTFLIFLDLFLEKDMKYFQYFFKEDSRCHRFWKVHGASINAFLASIYISKSMDSTLTQIIQGKLGENRDITIQNDYATMRYFPLYSKFEFSILNIACKSENILTDLKTDYMAKSEHFKNIMNSLNLLLPAKVKLQLMSHVKRRQLKPVSQTSTEAVRSTNMLQLKNIFYIDDVQHRIDDDLRAKQHFMENANKNLLKSLTFLYDNHKSLFDMFQNFLVTDSEEIQQDFNILKDKYKKIFKKIPKPENADTILNKMFSISFGEESDWPRLKISSRTIEASLPLATHLALWNVQEMSISARM